jgi:hypothetical protein
MTLMNGLNNLKTNKMNNNLEFENEDPTPDSIEDNHPRTNYGEGFSKQETIEEVTERYEKLRAAYDKNYIDSNDIQDLKESYYYKGRRDECIKRQAERMYSEAIEFAEWIRIKDFQTTSKNNWIGLDMKYYTTKELFEQFKNK